MIDSIISLQVKSLELQPIEEKMIWQTSSPHETWTLRNV